MRENNLKYCREEIGMTQTELGRVLGNSKSTVSGWENNYDDMPFKKIIAFCNLYNYSIDFVMGIIRYNIEYGKVTINKKAIGNNLKKLRKKLNKTQSMLAEDIGIPQTTYSDYERGKILISTIVVYKLHEKYNISIDWLCGRTNNMYISK